MANDRTSFLLHLLKFDHRVFFFFLHFLLVLEVNNGDPVRLRLRDLESCRHNAYWTLVLTSAQLQLWLDIADCFLARREFVIFLQLIFVGVCGVSTAVQQRGYDRNSGGARRVFLPVMRANCL